MPQYQLQIKATLEGVASLKPQPGRLWHVKTKCESCGETSDNFNTLSSTETVELEGSRGTAHLDIKCKMCERHGNVTIEEEGEYSDTSGEFGTVLVLDCRGVAPDSFQFMDRWVATSAGGAEFDDVDLTDGEWADYDEENDAAVSIMDLESQFAVAEKGKGKKGKRK